MRDRERDIRIARWIEGVEARTEAASPLPWDRDATLSYPGGSVTVENVVHNMWDVASCPGADVPPDDGRAGRAKADADFIAAARSDLPAAVAALRAVLDLHKPLNDLGYPPCAHCLTEDDGEALFVTYPCPTVRALTAALGVDR